METISQRINELIKETSLSNKEFANRVGINPSIVSHILSGRNKVSLQVIENITKEFTNVNIEYLLNGRGTLLKEFTNVNMPNSDIVTPKQPTENQVETKNTPQEPTNSETILDSPPPYPSQSNPTDIEQIVVFHKDGSFKAYKP